MWTLTANCSNSSIIFYPNADNWNYFLDKKDYGNVVQSYQLFKNGSFSTLSTANKTVLHTLQTVTNTTAKALHYWVNDDGTLNAYWSPSYWADQKEVSGLGLYWNGTSWISGNFTTQAS